MLLRVSRGPVVVALLLVFPFASSAAASPERAPAFRDTILSGSAPRALQAASEWGGPTTATDGEVVNLYFSDAYPVDQTRALQWADFMTSLIHGPELQTVAIHLAPLAEVQRRTAAADALACYSPLQATIYAPADDPAFDTSAKGILIHEYGHHIAASRANPPFESEDYGTKRWASYENVCSRTRAGDLFPGAEDSRQYMLNPGEAFAETYRLLNEQKLGLPQESWTIVSTALAPDPTALSLLEQDVTTPWTASTVKTFTAKLTGKVRTRTFVVSTPYDGTIGVVTRQAAGTQVKVSLLANKRTVNAKTSSRARSSVSSTVCGVRRYSVRAQLTGKVTKATKTTLSLTVSTALAELLLRQPQLHAALDDLADALGRHVRRLAERPRQDLQPVEDVRALVAEHLVDATEVVAVRIDDGPALLDQHPARRVGHQTERPPTRHTGPCVPTGSVSERTRRMRSTPGICSVSSRARLRRIMPAETP